MKRWTLSRLSLNLLAGFFSWLAAAALCLCCGSTGIHRPVGNELMFRCESVVVASLVGAALAAAGTAYQAVLRNPLADPYLLGASSGAALAAYIWRLPALNGRPCPRRNRRDGSGAAGVCICRIAGGGGGCAGHHDGAIGNAAA
jgi:ABC-type cobalamin transport system permease subunit